MRIPESSERVQVLEMTMGDQYLVAAGRSVSPSSATLDAPPAGTRMRCPPLVETPCTEALPRVRVTCFVEFV